MVRFGVRSAAGLVAAAGAVAGIAFGAAPAAAAEPTGLTFWSNDFTGASANYPTVPQHCTALPFAAHSQLNLTSTAITVYESTDCTGPALYFSANDIHSFLPFDGRSVKAAD